MDTIAQQGMTSVPERVRRCLRIWRQHDRVARYLASPRYPPHL